VKIENETRGLLRTFGVLIGMVAGGCANRTNQIVAGELDASPMMRMVVSRKGPSGAAGENQGPRSAGPCAARVDTTGRLFMSVPDVGPITALSVASAFDDVPASNDPPAQAPISA
jgi:hypothetical protein